MARLYADENFPRQIVNALRALGHDVLTASECERANQRIPDTQVIAFAHKAGRAVLTMDKRDFIGLHTASQEHSGIIVCKMDRDFAGQAVKIHSEITSLDTLAGQLVRIKKPFI